MPQGFSALFVPQKACDTKGTMPCGMVQNMPYLSAEQIRRAKEPDALTWLLENEPYKVVRIKDGYYYHVEHDSLKFDHGRWNWWSAGIGGRSAVDYLIKVEGFTFYDAALKILSGSSGAFSAEASPAAEREKKNKPFVVPGKNPSCREAVWYLTGRGISPNVINYFMERGDVYQHREHKNVVFLGRDKEGIPRLAALRGIYAKFHHTAEGSSRAYGFCNRGMRQRLDVFEAPVDLLSYATLLEYAGMDFKSRSLLALCGIYKGKKDLEKTKVPIAISTWLRDYPETEIIVLHFDSDNPGMAAAYAVQAALAQKKVIISPAPFGKDVNDYLQQKGKLWDI